MLENLTFELDGSLPSWNDYIDLVGRNRFLCREFTTAWKDRIEFEIWEALPQGVLDSLPLRTPLRLTVRVWRANRLRRDIHNLWVKPALDAFTEVGIWPDDSEKFIPQIDLIYMGVDKNHPHLSFEFRAIEVADEEHI
jgi:Holliday junction resolvase RusA-like endonuclease